MERQGVSSGDVTDTLAAVRTGLATAVAERNEVDLSWVINNSHRGKWSLPTDALQFLVALIKRLRPAHVLEFGTGCSTYVMARACLEFLPSCRITSVDHDPEFGAETAHGLKEEGLDRFAVVRVAPLVVREYEGRLLPAYYLQPDDVAAFGEADMVLIDGPPASLGGREGTLYQAMSFVRPGTLVLLDDAGRPGEQAAIARWHLHFGPAIEVIPLTGFKRDLVAILIRQPVPLRDLAAYRLRLAIEDIASTIPAGAAFLLVDDQQWDGTGVAPGRRPLPFLEREGQYWGPPPNDESAIEELARMHRAGADFIVFGWPAFWWFECYTRFHLYLRANFRCILENARLVVFDLRDPEA